MPIIDGSVASHYHDNSIVRVTSRILQKIKSSGLRGDELNTAIAPFRDNPPVIMHYHRGAYQLSGFSTSNASRFIFGANLTAADNILIVGAGMAWSAEWIEAFVPGITVTCIDASPWIQSVKDTDEVGDIEAALDLAGVVGTARDAYMVELNHGVRARKGIADENGQSNGSRARIRQNGPYTKILTEHVLEWLTDAEAANLSDIARQITNGVRVVHLVTPYSDGAAAKGEPAPYWNWKRINDPTPVVTRLTDQPHYTESDWSVLLPNDEFV